MKPLNAFLGSLVLPLVWMALTGTFNPANFLIGFVLSALCLWLVATPSEISLKYHLKRLWQYGLFVVFLLKEIIVANLKVARQVLSPIAGMQPAIIAIPLDIKTDFAITVLANMITLTPGTLSLDVSQSKKLLYVHAMHVDDPEAFKTDIKTRYERRVQEVFE